MITSNVTFEAAGAMALVVTDVHPVLGCPFTLPGPKPSPCVKITWMQGSPNTDADGVPVLTMASVGLCASPEGVPQGAPIMVSTQFDVDDA